MNNKIWNISRVLFRPVSRSIYCFFEVQFCVQCDCHSFCLSQGWWIIFTSNFLELIDWIIFRRHFCSKKFFTLFFKRNEAQAKNCKIVSLMDLKDPSNSSPRHLKEKTFKCFIFLSTINCQSVFLLPFFSNEVFRKETASNPSHVKRVIAV